MKLNFDVNIKEFGILRDILSQNLPSNVKIWIFGSRAKNLVHFNSDLDLAIESSGKLPRCLISFLEDEFSEAPLTFRVNVVDFNAVNN